MITLEGTARERGRAYGESLRFKIQDNVEYFLRLGFQKTRPEADAMAEQVLATTSLLARAEQWTPHLVEEVRGVAEGANLPFASVFALNELDALLGGSSAQCSALGVWGQAGRPTLLAQTADNSRFWNGHLTLLHIIYPDSDLQVYTTTFSGIIGVYGMSSRGIGVCINSLGELNGRGDGLGAPFVSRSILEQPDLTRVDEWMHHVRFAGGENYVVGGPDRVVDYECSANQIAKYRSPEGGTRLFHTNHVFANTDRIDQGDLPAEVQAQIPKRYANTHTRCATLEAHLGDASKPVTVEMIKMVLSTHGEWSICRHDFEKEPDTITNYTMIMELSDRPVLHLSSGPACYTSFWRFKF